MALLIVPILLFNFVISINMVSILKEDVKTVNTNNFLKTTEKIEQNFTDIRRIVSSISTNPSFNRIDLKQNSFREQLAVSYLKQCLYSDEFIYDIAYYLHDDDKIYSTTSVSELKSFYEEVYKFENQDYDSFFKKINSVTVPTSQLLNRALPRSDDTQEMIVYTGDTWGRS